MANEMKVTWHLTCGLGGYRFSHYLNTDDYTIALDKAVIVGKAYLKCLGVNVLMPLIVASNVSIRGDSQVRTDIGYTSPKAGGAPLNAALVPLPAPKVAPAVPDNADEWWTAALLRTGTSATKASRQFMRLIPDSITIGPVFSLRDTKWRAAVSDYFAALVDAEFGMFGLDRTLTSRPEITSYGAGPAAGDIVITTKQVHGIKQGEPFHVGYFAPGTAKTFPNGSWFCDAAPTTSSILVKANQGMTVPVKIKKNGFVWSLIRTFTAYSKDQCSIVRASTRKAGVPLGVLKGRNKRR